MKAFIAYDLLNNERLIDGNTIGFASQEPAELSWQHTGLIPHPSLYPDEVEQGLYASREHNGEQALCVAIVERILPSSTIKRHLTAKKIEFEAAHGQAVSKKQVAEWKEQFIDEMLPTCPLKETRIEVSFDYKHNKMLIGTSSQKVADHIVSWLRSTVFSTDNSSGLQCKLYRPAGIGTWLNNQLESGSFLNQSCKLQNPENGKKLSFTKDVGCVTAQEVFAENTILNVVELGCVVEDVCVFSVNEKSVVKGIGYIVTAEKQDEIEEAKSESASQFALAQHLLEVAAKRQILLLVKEAENAEQDDL